MIAAVVRGRPVPASLVEAYLANVPGAAWPGRERARRQRRRWATQLLVADLLARDECARLGLVPAGAPHPGDEDLADLGGIGAALLRVSAPARALVAHLAAAQHVPEHEIRGYYARNRDRFLRPEALRAGLDAFALPPDAAHLLVPYPSVHGRIAERLRTARAHRAFLDWLDRERAASVRLAPGYEHPGDPAQPDHEHRH